MRISIKHVVPVLAATNPYYILLGSITLLALAAYYLQERFLVVLVVSLSASFLYGSVEGAMRPSLAVQQPEPERSLPQAAPTAAQAEPSLVIYLILDEYMGPAGFPLDERASRAAVRSIYQTFLRYGFTVYSHAFSNYDNTFDSTISLLNLRVLEPGKEGESSESEQHSRQDYRLLAYFRDKGYLLNIYQSSVFDIFHPVPPANSNVLYDYSRLNVMHDLAMPWTDRLLLLGGRFSVENLALRLVDKNFCAACGRYGGVYFTTQWAFEVLDLLDRDVKAARQDSLFFAHLLTPHFSYVHRPDGSAWPASTLAHSTPPGSLRVGEPRYRELHRVYAGQVQYLNRRLRAFFEQLDRRNLLDRTTMIVHGDHGVRLLGKGRRTSPFRRLLEAYSTLLAVRMAPTRQGRVDSRKGSVLRFLAEELYGTLPDLTAASESVYVTNSDGASYALPFLDLWREWAENSPPGAAETQTQPLRRQH